MDTTGIDPHERGSGPDTYAEPGTKGRRTTYYYAVDHRRSGQSATIEFTRELIYPVDESGEKFEKHHIGKILSVEGSLLGFGNEVKFNYTDTTGGLDPSTGKPFIDKRTDVSDVGFSTDGGTRIVTQTRPDESRTLILLTSELIDATGRPIKDAP